MKRIALAAAGAAVIGLAACSQSPPPAAAPASHHTTTPAMPVSCSKRYHDWKHGQGKGIMSALRAVSSAEKAGGTAVLTAAVKKARPAVVRAARHPIPACADPRGYWDVLLMHVNAAVASKSSASSVRAAMKDVPEINGKLTAELRHMAR